MVTVIGAKTIRNDFGFSGLATVVDGISLVGGGAVVLGSQDIGTRPVL